MVLISVLCPHCQSDQVIKGGKTKAGKQRYKCQNSGCPCYSFQLDLSYKGRSPEILEQIIDMVLNGSCSRDTARVLKISPTTVINELKKEELALSSVNQRLHGLLNPEEVEVVIRLAGDKLGTTMHTLSQWCGHTTRWEIYISLSVEDCRGKERGKRLVLY